MKIDFNEMPDFVAKNMNGGNGDVIAKMYNDPMNRIVLSRLARGSSIGTHSHPTSSDINYIISGHGVAYTDGVKEELAPGTIHYAPKGSTHSIENTGDEDLVLLQSYRNNNRPHE